MKLRLIILILVLVTIVLADVNTFLIREAGISNHDQLTLIVPDIATNILAERELYPVTVLYENWENNAWVYDMKDTHSYDENGNPAEILMQEWLEGAWENFMKMCTECDEQGLIQEATIEIWDPVENIWANMMLMTYTYDANGNWTEIISEMWIYDQYMFSSRITREYNNQNQPTFESNFIWNYGGSWENDSQTTFSYSDEFLLEKLKESWEGDSYWENSQRTSYTQASGIYPATRLHQSWNGGGYWDNQRHSDYTYDSNWHEIEDYEQVWETDAWMNFQTHYYTFDGDNLLERLTKGWESERSWVNHDRYTVEYGALQAEDYQIPESNSFNLTNYPNPFNPSTEIRFTAKITADAKIHIYNLKGQEVNSLVCHPEPDEGLTNIYSVTWNGYDKFGNPAPSGIYYYKLSIGRVEQIRKMILMK